MLSCGQIVPGDRDFHVEVHHRAMRRYVEALSGWDELACSGLAQMSRSILQGGGGCCGERIVKDAKGG
jgi:hypothetical protein